MLRQSLPSAMSVERFLPPLFDVFGRAPAGHADLVNRDAFEQLTALLQAEADAPGRCILLRAPRAGYGKTHLLTHVERRLAGSHEFVLLTLADGSRMHAGSVLEDLLRRLCRPLPAAGGLTALDLIARRVLARGLEPLVRSGEVPCQDREGALLALQNRATETFDFHHPNAVTAHWTRENFALLGPRLGLELCEACGGPLREAIGWVDALFRFAAAPVDQPARIGNLIEWSLTGASMDRLACLLRLLAPLHRMVLVADEIEGLSSDPEAGLRLAAFVTSLRQTADRVLRSSMELGGNAPFLVLEGADVDAAVAGAMIAKMRNGGAACTAANRFYVHESLADSFATKFQAALGALQVGPGTDSANDLGAMVSVRERDKILDLVEEARAEGVKITQTTEVPAQGAFIAPMIVRDVAHGSTLTRNEIFGPVAPIVTFTDQAEAIRMANDTEYGLISYVYAANTGIGIGVARQMESGMVAINRGLASDPAAPFGGMKESGLGREGGFAGIHEFLEMQYFAVDL